ncbi:MAG: D-alanyl-D-alanine carboxypeptidase family protein [Lachnospiraceae bacterium]
MNNRFRLFTILLILTALLAARFGTVSHALADEAGSPALPITGGGPEISSQGAVVMEINSGAVLYAKNATTAYQPSSLTKLVTALVCKEQLSMRGLVTFSSTSASQDFPTASNAGFKNGETTTVEEAITGMIMCSADDCAVALAETAGGSMSGFAELMNTYASEHGYLNSNFVNSNGVQADGHYTCAYDMALAASELMTSSPEFKTAAGNTSATLSSSGGSLTEKIVYNTHRFIKGTDSYSYCYAGKTGGTSYGGDGTWSLCTFATYKGMNLVCIIMGAPSNDSTYEDTKALFDYAFENYESNPASTFLAKSGTDIGSLFSGEVFIETSTKSTIFTDPDAVIILPKNSDSSNITSLVSFTQINRFTYGNNIIGNIRFYYDHKLCGVADILFYSENASMGQSEFNKYFPDFLIDPDSNTDTNIYSDFGNTGTTEKQGFFYKIKAGIYSLYTPAKFFSFICALFIFLIGLLVIFLIFPVEVKRKDRLYRQDRESFRNSSQGDELSEVRAIRNSDVEDMHEIH